MKGITAKYLWTNMGVMMISLSLLGLAGYGVMTNHYRSYTENSLLKRAHSYAEILTRDQNIKTLDLLTQMEEYPAGKVFIFSDDGTVLAPRNPKEAQGEVFQTALRLVRGGQQPAIIDVTLNQSGQDWLFARSSYGQGEKKGNIVVGTELSGLDAAFHSFRSMLFLAGIGALLVAGGVSLLLARRTVEPVLEISRVAKRLSRGEYEARVSVQGQDELAALGHHMNRLAESLDYYRSSRKRFLSDVAHELRTPLSYVKGYTAVLLQRNMEPKQISKLIRIIGKQTDRLEKLVEDLVTLSRLDEGKLEIHLQEVNLREPLEKVCQEVLPRGEELGIALQLEMEEEIFLLTDPNRLIQILLNLMDNALRYSDPGSTVRLFTQRVVGKEEKVQIMVEDQGIGMKPEELEYIWNRFYRVESSRSRRFGGSGLGLSIVRQLVERLGGRSKSTALREKEPWLCWSFR